MTPIPRRHQEPHGPALGLSHRLLGRFHVTGVFWYRLHYWAAATLPVWCHRPLEVIFTTGFFFCLGRMRQAVASNLEPVLGPAGRWAQWRRAQRTLFAFANCLTARYRWMASPGQIQFEFEGKSFGREATANGQGAVLVTAHIGLWETSAQVGAEHWRRVVHVVREEEIDPKAQEFMRSLVAHGGGKCVTHFAGKDPGLAIELAEALHRGELVALQGDRQRFGGRTIATQIFGKPILLPIGPAALARAANVPLLPVYSFRTGARSGRMVIRPPVAVSRSADRKADLTTAMNRLAREIEWAISEYPHQWFCFRRLWD